MSRSPSPSSSKHSRISVIDINPKGLVPAVEYKGRALYESLILCEFLEDAYPSYKPNVLPADPIDRAYARIWIDFISKSIIPSWQRLLQAQTSEKQQEALEDLSKAQKTFGEKVKGPYFLGEEFSLVDIAVAPWVVRDYILAENRNYDRAAVSSEWKKYADHLEKRPTIAATTSVCAQIIEHRTVLMCIVGQGALCGNLWQIPARRGAERSREGHPCRSCYPLRYSWRYDQMYLYRSVFGYWMYMSREPRASLARHPLAAKRTEVHQHS